MIYNIGNLVDITITFMVIMFVGAIVIFAKEFTKDEED